MAPTPVTAIFGAGFTVAVAMALGFLLLGCLRLQFHRIEAALFAFVSGSAWRSHLKQPYDDKSRMSTIKIVTDRYPSKRPKPGERKKGRLKPPSPHGFGSGAAGRGGRRPSPQEK